MPEIKTITGKVNLVEEINGVKGHLRWAVTVSTQDGGSLKILVVDWDDVGACPLKEGTTQEITYKDWMSKQGVVYHNYLAPRHNEGKPKASGAAPGPIKMAITRKVGAYEYRIEVSGAAPEATAISAQKAIQALTQNVITESVPEIPEDDEPPF